MLINKAERAIEIPKKAKKGVKTDKKRLKSV